MVLAWASACQLFVGRKVEKVRDATFVSAILLLCLRLYFRVRDSTFVSATLLLCLRLYFRARDSTFVSATLLLCLRLYFCVYGCTFISATLLTLAYPLCHRSFLTATAKNDPSCELESMVYPTLGILPKMGLVEAFYNSISTHFVYNYHGFAINLTGVKCDNIILYSDRAIKIDLNRENVSSLLLQLGDSYRYIKNPENIPRKAAYRLSKYITHFIEHIGLLSYSYIFEHAFFQQVESDSRTWYLIPHYLDTIMHWGFLTQETET
ncbi:hypothetical protein PCH_Pc12g04070 [Penicillium rubens Wisconsin 54-1255]|uniref:Uncharacterized protein n=1 Tax=Penicillium rubens (strain ATCC 28089 / DSM 1075 / NRRL 1951 / Wisconsin 54-1255) TaxID=500485 RepID=B6GXB3_PENRW|nr:hypothetical protein PCH_Pc12g04070 [Penicillium rubens Wisconsin 54-1255]